MYKLGYIKNTKTTDQNGNIIENPNAEIEYINIIKIDDGKIIPMDLANTDYQEYLKWVEAGNTPLPSDYVDNTPE